MYWLSGCRKMRKGKVQKSVKKKVQFHEEIFLTEPGQSVIL